MSREIKFRVWSKEISAFVYLDLTSEKSISFCYGESEVLEQFTGLADDNNVQIYENDIVTWQNSDGEMVTSNVVYHNGAFCIHNYIFTLADYLCNHIEVIGNIHEHKHLLED